MYIKTDIYPFAPHYLDVAGGTMHYIDEGSGPPLVFVHGTPTWSFLYRHLISDLRKDYRCIAADQIGFGRSAKPPGWGYSFAEHTANLTALIDYLELTDITLVVHDLGGPIGLAYALNNPERIQRLVLFNTFLWPLEGEFALPPVAKLLGGPLGRWLYLYMNASARLLMPMLFNDRTRLTPAIHQHYMAPFARPDDRHGTYAFAKQMAAGAPACAELWSRHQALANWPTLLIWGMRDTAFGPRYLARWRTVLPAATVVEIPEASHFVQEEAPEEALQALRKFLAP